MSQSRKASFYEAVVNTFAGFVFSFILQKVLNYAYNVEMSNTTAFWFVFWFTVASIGRSYIIRRVANRMHLKSIERKSNGN